MTSQDNRRRSPGKTPATCPAE